MLLRRHLKHRGYEGVDADSISDATDILAENEEKADEIAEDFSRLSAETEKDIINYEELTVDELKELAKDKEITGYSNMKKAELIEALTDD